MRKIFLSFLVLLIAICTNAQLALNANDKLIYDVGTGGVSYNFTIKIKTLKPGLNFVWQMTNDDASYGNLKVSANAMATSLNMYNYFSSGNKTLKDATSVILSKAAYKEIIEKKKVTLWDDGKKFVFENPDETDFSYMINGEEKYAKAIYLADANNHDIIVLKNADHPLILKMDLGWVIKLNTIIPATKTITDISTFIDKKITDVPFLWDKLDKSSQITTEDLTGVGIYSGPSVFKEYFSHIEGLWVKAHNDTVTEIVYYPTPMTHSSHTYYGGNISIPQLSAYTFNRAIAKTFVKTKFVEKTSYDSDVYEASAGTIMELYYNVPEKTKEGINFGISSEGTPKAKQILGFITFQKK